MPPPNALTAPSARAGWMQLLSPGSVDWSCIKLPCGRAPALAGLRLLHLSDLHLRSHWYRAYDTLIGQINEAKLDLIALTGDLIDNRWNPTEKTLHNTRRFLDRLSSRFGTFVIIGNHDGDLLARHVARTAATLLHPGLATIAIGNAVLELIGLPCVHRKDLSPRVIRRFPPRPDNSFRVVLSHYPDHIRKLLPLQPDLVLSGHTHGGQVCLPGGRPIITHDALPAEMSVGLHQVNGCRLLVSRGVGFASYPVRVFAPPQVVVVELV